MDALLETLADQVLEERNDALGGDVIGDWDPWELG
jgi:hypothetical protein